MSGDQDELTRGAQQLIDTSSHVVSSIALVESATTERQLHAGKTGREQTATVDFPPLLSGKSRGLFDMLSPEIRSNIWGLVIADEKHEVGKYKCSLVGTTSVLMKLNRMLRQETSDMFWKDIILHVQHDLAEEDPIRNRSEDALRAVDAARQGCVYGVIFTLHNTPSPSLIGLYNFIVTFAVVRWVRELRMQMDDSHLRPAHKGQSLSRNPSQCWSTLVTGGCMSGCMTNEGWATVGRHYNPSWDPSTTWRHIVHADAFIGRSRYEWPDPDYSHALPWLLWDYHVSADQSALRQKVKAFIMFRVLVQTGCPCQLALSYGWGLDNLETFANEHPRKPLSLEQLGWFGESIVCGPDEKLSLVPPISQERLRSLFAPGPPSREFRDEDLLWLFEFVVQRQQAQCNGRRVWKKIVDMMERGRYALSESSE